ncbi:MAG TPA: ABC transporter transmembrane domain-containing protein, partial [Chitinophagales bacterium]|nr:ABC transporter transmembrane domain-containing protein [Chitinophagales bacterium]
MVIPFLQIIFKMVTPPTSRPEFRWNIREMLGILNYEFASYVNAHGAYSGLILVSIGVVFMFLFKNIFRYLALYFLAPLRTGVVRELRQGVFDKILQLPLAYFSETRKGDIIARMSNDVKEVESSMMNTIESTFRDPVTM